jgi:hypothetical protein
MKRTRFQTVLTTILGLVCLGLLVQTAWADQVPRMTKEELRPLLGDPDVIILDVRVGRSWTESQWKIQGAIREDPSAEVASWAHKYPLDKTLVLYCT